MSLISNFITRTVIAQKSVPSIPSCCLHLQCVYPKSETANIRHDMWRVYKGLQWWPTARDSG
eukprot:111895-Pelagomonas_calceolata.AAC.1